MSKNVISPTPFSHAASNIPGEACRITNYRDPKDRVILVGEPIAPCFLILSQHIANSVLKASSGDAPFLGDATRRDLP